MDVLVDQKLILVSREIKSGQTISGDYFSRLHKWLAGAEAGKAYLV